MALKTLNWISLEREVWMQFMMDVFCILRTFTTDTYKVRKNTSKMLKLAQQNHQSATLKQNLASCTCTLCAWLCPDFGWFSYRKIEDFTVSWPSQIFPTNENSTGKSGMSLFSWGIPEFCDDQQSFTILETNILESFTVRDIGYYFSSS